VNYNAGVQRRLTWFRCCRKRRWRSRSSFPLCLLPFSLLFWFFLLVPPPLSLSLFILLPLPSPEFFLSGFLLCFRRRRRDGWPAKALLRFLSSGFRSKPPCFPLVSVSVLSSCWDCVWEVSFWSVLFNRGSVSSPPPLCVLGCSLLFAPCLCWVFLPLSCSFFSFFSLLPAVPPPPCFSAVRGFYSQRRQCRFFQP